MALRWTISLVLSLAIHLVWVGRSSFVTKTTKQPPQVYDLVSVKAEPRLSIGEVPLPPPSVSRPDLEDTQESLKFRPNEDPQEDSSEVVENQLEEVQETAMSSETPPVENVSGLETEEAVKEIQPTLTRQEVKRRISQYREQLARRFKDQYTKVPELHTVISDQQLVPQIDQHFGIRVLAYSYVNHQPGPPFILFDGAEHQQVDQFDFSTFSNRIKDRSIYGQYRSALKLAQEHFEIRSLMKIVGLVPLKTDQYFAAKQLSAIEQTRIAPDQVKTTNAHYESDSHGGFNLIIDTIMTKDGRTLKVQDEERALLAANPPEKEIE